MELIIIYEFFHLAYRLYSMKQLLGGGILTYFSDYYSLRHRLLLLFTCIFNQIPVPLPTSITAILTLHTWRHSA